MAAKPLTLEPPAKDFGKGMNRTLIASIIAVIWALSSSFRIIMKFFTNSTAVQPMDMMLLLVAAGVFIYTSCVLITYRKDMGPNSARLNYVKKHLIPYLTQKYNIKIPHDNAQKVIDGEPLFKDKQKREVFFHGWDAIEEEAQTQAGADLTDAAFLLRKEYEDRDDYFEYPPADGEGGVSFLSAPKKIQAPASKMSVIDEAGVYLWMNHVIANLPAGASRFESINGKPAPDPWNIFELETDEDGSVSYSNNAMKKFAHELYLLCQKGQNQVEVYTTLSKTGEIYGANVLLSKEGIFYYDYPEGEREIQDSLGRKITMLSSLEELYDVLEEKPEEDTGVKRFIFLIKKIVAQLPAGKSLLMVANTFNEEGVPANLEVRSIDNSRVNYSDEELENVAAALKTKVEEDGDSVILAMINHEINRKTYALGIFITPESYSFIPAKDMRERFGMQDSEAHVIDSLKYFDVIKRTDLIDPQ